MKTKQRSPKADDLTPARWNHVNLIFMPNEDFPNCWGLSIGKFDCYVGTEQCKAAGIGKAWCLTFQDAINCGDKLDAYLENKNKDKRNEP